MAKSQHEKFAVRKGFLEQTPEGSHKAMTYMSNRLVPEADYHVQLSWILDLTQFPADEGEYRYDHDRIILFLGGDFQRSQDLGATMELCIGGQALTFNTTSALFLPKGICCGPLKMEAFRHPHLQVALTLGDGAPKPVRHDTVSSSAGEQLPLESEIFDYEQYMVRSPLREAGTIFTQGRQTPTMTYMSRNQVNISNYYIELGWIWGMVSPDIPRMRHEKYDELVLHIGGDPNHPEDLGAVIEFGMGDDILEFDTTHCMWIPRGLNHGPLRWKAVEKPHIEIAIMLGAGTFQEGWEDSFLE